MFKQPSEVHNCGICNSTTQTLHGRACCVCQKRINAQVNRYFDCAEVIVIEIGMLFGEYEKQLEDK
jgi:hypothetical protein